MRSSLKARAGEAKLKTHAQSCNRGVLAGYESTIILLIGDGGILDH